MIIDQPNRDKNPELTDQHLLLTSRNFPVNLIQISVQQPLESLVAFNFKLLIERQDVTVKKESESLPGMFWSVYLNVSEGPRSGVLWASLMIILAMLAFFLPHLCNATRNEACNVTFAN